MNRFKKYIKEKGVKLECDYPMIPFNGLEAVNVHPENACVCEYYVYAGWVTTHFLRDGSQKIIDQDKLFG